MTDTMPSLTSRLAILLGTLAVGLAAAAPTYADAAPTSAAAAPTSADAVHVAAPAAKPRPSGKWVADADVGFYVGYSAWAYINQIIQAGCTGTGPAHHLPGVTTHHTFRCIVEEQDGSKTTVEATALGPEWLRVTKVSGGLKPDRGIGPVPKGPHLLDDGDAEDALQDSAWGSRHNIDAVFCSGIGNYTAEPDTDLFGAFDCGTTVEASTGPQVIIRVINAHSSQIVRTIKR